DVLFSNGTDTTPPTISAVQSSAVSGSGATVTWTTGEAADSQVEYGPTTSYGASTTLDATLATAHSLALSGLTANTLYHYRVKSTDANGNPATSADFTFTTTDAAGCPCSIWTGAATPATPAEPDSAPIEVGVKFRSSVAGYVS